MGIFDNIIKCLKRNNPNINEGKEQQNADSIVVSENLDKVLVEEKQELDISELILNRLIKFPIHKDENAVKLKRKLASEIDELKFSSVTKSTNVDKIKNFVVIDTETTGISLKNRIIELSAIKFENFYPVASFSTLINPTIPIPEEATKISGITDEMVKGMPELYQVKEQFEEFVGNLPIVAHNAEFDIKHLYASGIDLTKHKIFDTLSIAKKSLIAYDEKKADRALRNDKDYEYDVDNYKLTTLANYCGYYFNAHRALDDCFAAGFIFIELISDKNENVSRKFANDILKNEIS